MPKVEWAIIVQHICIFPCVNSRKDRTCDTYTYACMHRWVDKHTDMRTPGIDTCVHMNAHMRLHVAYKHDIDMCTYIHACMFVYVHTYVYKVLDFSM